MATSRFLVLLFFSLVVSLPSYAYQQFEFVTEIGCTAEKAKRILNEPRAVALAGDKIYITDTDAHRVLVLSMDGQVLLKWGKKGDKPGQFRSPSGIAVDEQGRVFVADTGNHRIQVFDAGGKPIRNFGGKGDDARKFHTPSGLFAQRGLLYVADTGNSRVQVLTSDGIFIRQISVKTKKDEMKEPVAVAVDLQNRIYVLDADMHKIRIFDHDGKQLDQFGSEGKGTEGFDEPQGLAVDSHGGIYVADTGNYKLKKFDPRGRLVASVGCEGDGPGQFRKPAGLAVNDEGRVFVVDTDKKSLQVFSSELNGKQLLPASPPVAVKFAKAVPAQVDALTVGKKVWAITGDTITRLGDRGGPSIGTRGSKPGMLRNPRGIAIDPAGNFWVVDTGNNRLQKFSPEGNLLHVIGRPGSGEGEFRSPSSVAVSSKGNLYVADTGNERVQVFSAKGMFLGTFGKSGNSEGQFDEPVDIAIDGKEHIYVADCGNNRIAKYDSNGSLLWEKGGSGRLEGEFRAPSNIVVSPDNEVYVLDSGNARILVFDATGKFVRMFGSEGDGPGELQSPQGLAMENGVRLYVGDRGNKRVQVFTVRQTPAVPTDLSAQARANEVQVNWKNNSESYFDQYRIYRAETSPGPFKLAGTTADPFFMDRGLDSNKTFFYRVASTAREGNESAPSAVVSAVTPKLVPGSPKKVRIEALEKQITLSWLPNLEPYVSHYNIYRTRQVSSGFELLAKTEATVFVDASLADETFYYYQVTAVGREGDESRASEAVFAATPKARLTLPSIEISSVEVTPIFAAAYKYYESHPAGKVTIRNNTNAVYPKVKLSFSIRDFMDYPTEIEIGQVDAKQQVEILLKPVFSNRILTVTENTPVQSELALTYYIGGEAKTVTRSFPVTIYERHAMIWDQKSKLGAFVTPKDPPVADFSRSVIRQYVDAYPNLHSSIVYARALYAALGAAGLKYMVDPSSPFQEFSEKSAVDYLQYPRDTLARKSGDCDDLSILFAAAMENIGIGTAFVDVPGHVFVMINTGVRETDKIMLGFSDRLLVPHQGTVWIPVEMTLVGSSFTKAWRKAAEAYRAWSAKGQAEIVDTRKAWEMFKPVTLPSEARGLAKVTREEIEALFTEEVEALARQRLANLSEEYLNALRKDPNNTTALGQLGILYGENGLFAEALQQFQKILAIDKDNSPALNNIGNINFLQERFEDAKTAYEASLAGAPEDTGTMTNLSRLLLRMGKKEEAKKRFREATSLDPRVLRGHAELAASLGITK